ncbi:hypothetical protein PACID_20470 [Acidipropionibacterium acidipropionici ATCC 4875]|uniref:Uncharacterized protein n=1 Tax=Acidipropionibacterium acidipropionici (strain ATCC 4875 / DSM 20272 / JCM 6432 / NBRC 12425 / NCIMB 8070 / 4) TaxID=1171373 RepID=K7SKQ8_ACIA4|nr:hypothetical protein PACID_20470 [Acidipropionibacterium acidipropionici ATCC 4875]
MNSWEYQPTPSTSSQREVDVRPDGRATPHRIVTAGSPQEAVNEPVAVRDSPATRPGSRAITARQPWAAEPLGEGSVTVDVEEAPQPAANTLTRADARVAATDLV